MEADKLTVSDEVFRRCKFLEEQGYGVAFVSKDSIWFERWHDATEKSPAYVEGERVDLK